MWKGLQTTSEYTGSAAAKFVAVTVKVVASVTNFVLATNVLSIVDKVVVTTAKAVVVSVMVATTAKAVVAAAKVRLCL